MGEREPIPCQQQGLLHQNTSACRCWLPRQSAIGLCLLDEKGADVNAKDHIGDAPLHLTDSPEIITALLNHVADPCLLSDITLTPLMWHAYRSDGKVACVTRLLQDPRVRATVNLQDGDGITVLHDACTLEEDKNETSAMVRDLLQAGANPFLTDKYGLTPLAVLQQQWPENNAAISLLLQALDAQKASVLVKARRLFVASTSNARAPSYLQGRVVRGQPLPRVMLPRTPLPRKVKAGLYEDGEESRKLRTLLVFCPWYEGRA